jgi:hypothetical protein
MQRPTKKDIKAALDKLRQPPEQNGSVPVDFNAPPIEAAKKNQRIRKKGI